MHSSFQFYTDANEAESWMNEKLALVKSDDYGVDEPSAQALIQRHRDLEGEINAYNTDIQSLNSQAKKLIEAGINTLEVIIISELHFIRPVLESKPRSVQLDLLK